MLLSVVSIRDRAANGFARPIFVNHLGQAIRSFQDEINRADANNELHRHPEDFDLYHLGSFDDEQGMFTSLPQPKMIAIGHQLKNGA